MPLPFCVCQQEEEQSLVNVLEENVDKMQLTRKILDLKQVTLSFGINKVPEVEPCAFPYVNRLHYNFATPSLIYG